MKPTISLYKQTKKGAAADRKRCHVKYNNIRELRRDIKNQLYQSIDGEIKVTRELRDFFGIHVEHWHLLNGKPIQMTGF